MTKILRIMTLLTGFVIILTLLCINAKAETNKPNIVLIQIDNLAVKKGENISPNINKLSQSSAVLSRFYNTTPISNAIQYSILTGKFAGKNPQLQKDYPLEGPALISNDIKISEEDQTIFSYLGNAGYNIGIMGQNIYSGIQDLFTNSPEKYIDDNKGHSFFLYLNRTCSKSSEKLQEIDAEVGSIIKQLESNKILENTLIILLTNNCNGNKSALYEENVKHTALIYWKNHIKPIEISELTANIDILPTILDACHISSEDDMDGKSLLPLFKGGVNNWRNSLYLEFGYTRGIVTKNWKYIATRFPEVINTKIPSGNDRNYNHHGIQLSTFKEKHDDEKNHPYYFDPDQLYYLPKDPSERVSVGKAYNYVEKVEEYQVLLKEASKEIPHKFGEF